MLWLPREGCPAPGQPFVTTRLCCACQLRKLLTAHLGTVKATKMIFPRIYITGASCSGATTFGHALAERLELKQLDVDDFFWMQTNPPFTKRRERDDRVRLIREQQPPSGWILTGSLDGWRGAF